MYLNYQTFNSENLASKCFLCDPSDGYTMYFDVQHYFRILQFRHGGDKQGALSSCGGVCSP